MRIEFDAPKRAATLEARGLDMARAEEVLTGATLTVEDHRRGYGEDRFIHRRFSRRHDGGGRLDSRKGAYRIISMRKANERERRLYAPRF